MSGIIVLENNINHINVLTEEDYINIENYMNSIIEEDLIYEDLIYEELTEEDLHNIDEYFDQIDSRL